VKRSKDGRRYLEKGKGGEGDGIYRKNEKGARGSRNSIEEGTGGNKKASRQKKKETEEWEKGDKVMLSTKDLVFKERPVRKLVE